MKSIYSIGRDPSSDICVADTTMMVSRAHAVLRVKNNGQYTISDQSTNGTYVNGMRISSGVEVPVSRKDTINFAHVADLDWSIIPNPRNKLLIILGSVIGGLLLLGAIFFGMYSIVKKMNQPETPVITTPPPVVNEPAQPAAPPDNEGKIVLTPDPPKPAPKPKQNPAAPKIKPPVDKTNPGQATEHEPDQTEPPKDNSKQVIFG